MSVKRQACWNSHRRWRGYGWLACMKALPSCPIIMNTGSFLSLWKRVGIAVSCLLPLCQV